MKNCLKTLWSDERGFLVSTELILIATILVIGLIAGMACLQQAIVQEFNDLSWAVSSLNQTYRTNSYFGCKGAFSGGSAFYGNSMRPGYAMPGYGMGGSFGYGYSGGVGGVGGGYAGGGSSAKVLYNNYGADLGPCVTAPATSAPAATGKAVPGAKQPAECPPSAGPYSSPIPLGDPSVNLPCPGCNPGETSPTLTPQPNFAPDTAPKSEPTPTAPSGNALPSPPTFESK